MWTQEPEDVFIGYNEWAKEDFKITMSTDFVYDEEDGNERGVYIAEDILPQTVVLTVPFHSMLTIKWIEQQCRQGHSFYSNIPMFQQVMSDDWDMDDEDHVLVVALLYEKWIAGQHSRWHNHLVVLPTSYHNLLYFTDTDLAALRGSNVYYIAEQMKQKVSEMYSMLNLDELLIGLGSPCNRTVVEESFSLTQYQWAISTVWSRFVTLASEGNMFKAMVPVFDLLNHDPFAQMTHQYNTKNETFELTSHQRWCAGHQLYINYGALSNHKLLTLYGFVLDENPFNTVEMWLPMSPTTLLYNEKQRVLASNGISHKSTSFDLADNINELLLMVARIQQLEDAVDFDTNISCILNGQMISVKHETQTLCWLIYQFEQMIQRYNVEEKKRDEEDDTLHTQMAKILCENDLVILHHNIDMLKELIP